MLEADNEGTKEVDSKMLVITDSSSIVQKSSQMKQMSTAFEEKSRNLLLLLSTELSLLKRKQVADDKHYKIMQLIIEERKIGMLEKEPTIEMGKLKASTKREERKIGMLEKKDNQNGENSKLKPNGSI